MRRFLVILLTTVLVTPTAAARASTAAEPSPDPTVTTTSEPSPDPTPEPTTEPDPVEPEPTDPPPTTPSPTVTLDVTTVRVWARTTAALAGRVDGASPTSALRVARRSGDRWTALAGTSVVTGSDGRFTARVPAAAGRTTVRVELVDAGAVVAASAPADVVGAAAPSTARIAMPKAVTDYRKAKVAASWRTVDGRAVSARLAVEFRRSGTRTWVRSGTVTLRNGKGSTFVKPRYDGRWRVRSFGTSTVLPTRSSSVYVDNRPPGSVIRLPKGTPGPRIRLAAQPRAPRVSADATVSRIPTAMWRSMRGRSWHAGCPVGRDQLRVVRVSYWAFDGYVRRGEIVVHAQHARATAAVFTDLFRMRAPIRSMYRVDRFGWSSALRGADDYASMRADNTSGFNCRQVVGRPGTRSPHAYGNSIDINPWENPFASGYGWTPNSTWQRRTTPAASTYRGANDPVVAVLRRHGFRWLGFADLHHFQR